MESSMDLSEFLVINHTTTESYLEPPIDLQYLHVSPRRSYSSPGHAGAGGEGQEPVSGGVNSSTTSETKKQGKFRFLTNHNQTNAESTLGSSPYGHEPSSAEISDEAAQDNSSGGTPRSRRPRLTPEFSTSRPATSLLSSCDPNEPVFSISVPPLPTVWNPTDLPDQEEYLINKHVKRLLKVTEISDNIMEGQEDFEEEDDDDFDSRLDQMIAEDEQQIRKRGRKKSTGKSGLTRRRSTRNSRKSEVVEELVDVAPAVDEKVAVAPSITTEPKKRGRKKKVVPLPPSDPSRPTEDPPDRDITSDDAASQVSEIKPDSEDLSDSRPGKLKTRWVEQTLSISTETSQPDPTTTGDASTGQEKPVSFLSFLPVNSVVPTPTSSGLSSQAGDLESTAAGTYDSIVDCLRLSRHKIRDDREARKMRCDCQYTQEEAEYRMKGCTEGCLNRMLYIECGPKCSAKGNCSNKRFQNREYAQLEIFKTKLKGHGIRAKQPLIQGQFITEYVGEVLDARQFKKRQRQYADDNIQHHYFMALNNDEVIDATRKGNCSRFTNHSCDPNAETQKWTVAGQLRIGFFALRPISVGEEITFDYQFERYGKKAQRCYCGSSLCRGFIGSAASGEEKKKTSKNDISDRKMVSEIDKFAQMGSVRTEDQALRMARLLLRIEEDNDRMTLLRVLQNSELNVEALKAFLRCQGVTIMADMMYVCRNSSSEMKIEILNTLAILPLTTRNPLVETKIWETLERWAGLSVSRNSTSAGPSGPDSAPGVVKTEESSVAGSPAVTTNGPTTNGLEAEPISEASTVMSEEPVSSTTDGSPKEPDSAVTGSLKREYDDSDSQSQDTMDEPAVLDDVERVKQLARDVLQVFTDTLKMTFKIPKKLNQDREPSSSEEARKSPAKTSLPIAGTTIPTLAPGWLRSKRSPSPASEDVFFRPKIPRLAYPRYGLFRRPLGGHMFPHHPGAFPHHPPFAHMIPLGMQPNGIGVPIPSLSQIPLPTRPDLVTVDPDAEAKAAAAAEEQARIDADTAADLVSRCLLNNTVSGSRAVSLRLNDGSMFDARTFAPSPSQIELIRQELPTMSTADWEGKAELIRQRSGLEAKPLDPPVTQETVGWMSNFDLSKHKFLPMDWCAAYDQIGRLYFYNISNGVSRWDFPTEDHIYSTVLHAVSSTITIPADLKDTTTLPVASVNLQPWDPVGDDDDSPRENTVPPRSTSRGSTTTTKSHLTTTTTTNRHHHHHNGKPPPRPDKSLAGLRKRKIDFQNDVCQYILQVLNAYRLPSCTQGRIETKEDFKYLARKFTHTVLEQETNRHRDTPEHLKFSSKHKPKIKEHIRKYMTRFGKVYKATGGGDGRSQEEANRRRLTGGNDEGDEEDEDDEEEDDLEDEEEVVGEEREDNGVIAQQQGESVKVNGDVQEEGEGQEREGKNVGLDEPIEDVMDAEVEETAIEMG